MINTVSIDAVTWTAAELKTHCRIDGTAEDSYLLGLADVATEYIQNYTGIAFTDATYDEHCPHFGSKEIHLSKPGTVVSVSYWDTDGTQQTWDSTNYLTTQDDHNTVIRPKKDVTYPETYTRRDAVTVRYSVAAIASKQYRFRQCVYLLVSHFFENRTAEVPYSTSELKLGVQRLLDSLHQGAYQ